MAATSTGYRSSALLLLLASIQVNVNFAAPAQNHSGTQISVPDDLSRGDGSCPVVNMTAESHQLFYEFCHNVDSRSNATRNTAYLPDGYAKAAEDFKHFELVLKNQASVTMSDYCLAYLRPYVCFIYFPFSWPPVTSDTCKSKSEDIKESKPCHDFCERTSKACKSELEMMIAGNSVLISDLEKLQCSNFEEEDDLCVYFPPVEEPSTSSSNMSSDSSGNSTTLPSSDCKCANVRKKVTKKTFVDTRYTYSMAAHVLVISFGEEDNHVVYEVEVIKEYRISCFPPLETNTTTVHTQQPMECRGDDAETTDCVYMDVDKQYMIVGHHGKKGEWLLKDLKGTGGTVVSPWNDKYAERLDEWVSNGRPVNFEEC